MPTQPYPSAARIQHLTEYSPDTGALLWRPRRADDFLAPLPDSQIKRWNTRFSGKPAFGSTSQKSRYPNGYLDGHCITKHRAAWASYYGVWPLDQIDHINRDVHDNRIANLRQCTATENLRNRGIMRSNTSGVTGVHMSEGMWVARIGHNCGHKQLGRFAKKEDAIWARRIAEADMGYGADAFASE